MSVTEVACCVAVLYVIASVALGHSINRLFVQAERDGDWVRLGELRRSAAREGLTQRSAVILVGILWPILVARILLRRLR